MTRAKAKRHVCLPSNDLLERCLTIPNMQPPLPSYISHIYCTFFTHLQISQTSQTTNTFHHTLLVNETKGRRSYRNWRKKSWVTFLKIGKLVWIEDHFTKRVRTTFARLISHDLITTFWCCKSSLSISLSYSSSCTSRHTEFTKYTYATLKLMRCQHLDTLRKGSRHCIITRTLHVYFSTT